MEDTRVFHLLPEDRAWLRNLRVGDPVMRWLAGICPMPLTVSEITPDLIRCQLWDFDPINGAEIDERFGWGRELSGSFILSPNQPPTAEGRWK